MSIRELARPGIVRRARRLHLSGRMAAAQSSITSVTEKALMGVTGLILTLYVVGHLAGNLIYYAGAERFDAYAELLHRSPFLLWVVRFVLFTAFVVHVGTALDLYNKKSHARPIAYARYGRVASSAGARTMLLTGFVLLAFVIYHILHLTLGVLHPAYIDEAVWHNVSTGFSVAPVVVFYLVSMVALGLHLSHGVLSMTQSVGFEFRRGTMRKMGRFTLSLAIALAFGFASIPLTTLVESWTSNSPRK